MMRSWVQILVKKTFSIFFIDELKIEITKIVIYSGFDKKVLYLVGRYMENGQSNT